MVESTTAQVRQEIRRYGVRAHKIERRSMAFILNEKDLSQLNDLVRSYCDSIGFTAECSDHTVRFFENIRQLKEYQNPASASIKILSIQGKSENGEKECVLEFGSSSPNNIKVELKGEESYLILFSKKLDSIIAGMKSWYSLLSTEMRIIAWMLPIILFIPAILLTGISQIKGGKILPADPPTLTLERLMFALGIDIVLFTAIAIIHSWLFPLAVFEIGQGIKQSKLRQACRNFFIVTLIGGIIASIIAGIILTRIG